MSVLDGSSEFQVFHVPFESVKQVMEIPEPLFLSSVAKHTDHVPSEAVNEVQMHRWMETDTLSPCTGCAVCTECWQSLHTEDTFRAMGRLSSQHSGAPSYLGEDYPKAGLTFPSNTGAMLLLSWWKGSIAHLSCVGLEWSAHRSLKGWSCLNLPAVQVLIEANTSANLFAFTSL